MLKEYLEAGKIVKPHGVKGEIVLEVWADSPDVLIGAGRFWFDENGRHDAGVTRARPQGSRLLLKLQGVDRMDDAEKLRGKILYIKREDITLPEGKFFIADLMGLKVIDGNSGKEYGEISEVLMGVANDVYVVKNQNGEEFLFPAVRHMIKSVDVIGGRMEVLPIPGIFDKGGVEA